MLLIRITLCSFLLVVLAGCSVEDGRPLKIGSNLWLGYEPLYLAQYIGAYQSRVDLVQLASATEVMRALRYGNIHAAALTLDEALSLMSEDVELVVLLALDFSDGADVLMALDDKVEAFRLQGKRIGVESTALGALILSEALEQQGLTIEDIEIENLSMDTLEQALLDQRVDAVVTFEPMKTRLLEKGARVVFDTSQAPGLVVDVLVVRRKQFDQRRKDIIQLINGYFAAREYMVTDREEALKFFSKRLGLDVNQVQSALDAVHLPSLQENIQWFAGSPSEFEQRLRSLSALLSERQLIEQDTPLVIYSDASWLQEVRH